MKKRIILIVALVAVAAAFAARFQALGRTRAPASLESVQAAAGKPVEVVTAARGDIECWVALAGTVEGVVQYAVTSTNALRIVAIPVREGDRVKAGDVIVRLAREAPTPMVHSYARAQATYDNTLKDVQRLRALHAQGAISDQALDQAETRLKVAAADLQDVEGSTSLVAAQGGVVAGIVVNPGDTAEAGKPLVWIARTDDVKVCFTAGSRQALALAPGQPAVWTGPDGTDLAGEVSRLDLRADPKTHLLAGEALFPNPDGRLVPGLLVSVRVRTGVREGVVRVPAAALVDGPALFVVGDDGVARKRPVTAGASADGAVEIAAGIAAGERVVLHGQSRLADGDRVKTVED
ncbi:MAG: efflux RND transporter periplasmic adaptor subunit [bacterium]|nr:efflux RND transporter periplasmic adaptor subunit [bacterium]